MVSFPMKVSFVWPFPKSSKIVTLFAAKPVLRPDGLELQTLAGRVEDWRGIPKGQPSRFAPFPLGVPQYPNRDPVSSPRHIAPSVRISRTGRTCLLSAKSYVAYRAGATFAPDHRTSW